MTNLIFDELIAERKCQFVFIFTPAPIKGGNRFEWLSDRGYLTSS